MLEFVPKEGAYVNTLSLMLYYRHFGIHPTAMPWRFSQQTTEELLNSFEKVEEEGFEASAL